MDFKEAQHSKHGHFKKFILLGILACYMLTSYLNIGNIKPTYIYDIILINFLVILTCHVATYVCTKYSTVNIVCPVLTLFNIMLKGSAPSHFILTLSSSVS